MKRFIALFAVLALLALPAFAQDEMTPTIAEIVVSSTEAEEPEFTTLLAALQAADESILGAVADPESTLTVFAPTDAAFAALAEALGEEAFNEILTEEGTPRLNEILLYHVVSGSTMSGDVVAALGENMGEFSVRTLSGQLIDIAGMTDDEGAVDLEAGITVDAANLNLEMVDIEASNGVIHVIDAVLVPELNTIADVVVASTEADEPEFTTLLTAIGAADPAILELLSDPEGDFTVFAPTDEAFAAVEGLEEIVADTELLTAILQYHVLPGTVYAAEIPGLVDEDGVAEITMADGSTAVITVTDMGVMINEANIVITDIETTNGVIHVIDAVLVPGMDGM